MAKALYGHLGYAPGTRHETVTLRRRIADLEAEVLRLKTENDQLRTEQLFELDRATEQLLETTSS